MKKPIRITLFAVLVLAAPPAFADDTLFADMGGQPGIDKIVEASVANYLADPRIKALFDESNMERIRAEFKVQFCQVAGGPCAYKGHDMTAAHRGLHLTNADFNAVVEDLQVAMDTCGVGFAVQNRFLARLAPMQHQVVTR
ncbi:MAG TPA: group 1 truncated hemoglobin [Rhizomicrobium sp.]|nr:group 1 truncated hemoglobin [Rhizomicrobium sp.]